MPPDAFQKNTHNVFTNYAIIFFQNDDNYMCFEMLVILISEWLVIISSRMLAIIRSQLPAIVISPLLAVITFRDADNFDFPIC